MENNLMKAVKMSGYVLYKSCPAQVGEKSCCDERCRFDSLFLQMNGFHQLDWKKKNKTNPEVLSKAD